MKKHLLLCCIALFTAFFSFAQTAEWKVALAKDVEQKFSLSDQKSREVINIKEQIAQSIMAYRMPHMETQIGKEAVRKAIQNLEREEIVRLNTALKDEAKAKEVSQYLEGKIQLNVQPRKR
jgi:uncharacterized protein YaaW (UPF0174 family)